MNFPTDITSIVSRVYQVSPKEYGRTRNYKDGTVTYLSPYISRGVISTKYVYEKSIERGFSIKSAEKFYQELAWRDYWQRKWQALGNAINQDIGSQYYQPEHHKIPSAIVNASTGINAVDKAIRDFYETGYMHNHMRMYVAGIICPIGKAHWNHPAQWMYYHLLDADWASNALSWQWVAGTSRNCVYFANQENINKYWNDDQKNTFLDKTYDTLPPTEIPKELSETQSLELSTALPSSDTLNIDKDLPTFIYNVYNLDPFWKSDLTGNRILLFEPQIFEKYPMSSKTIQFVLELSKNIKGIQVFTGTFSDLTKSLGDSNIFFKEHPLNRHYEGKQEERDWMFPNVTTADGSFFSYWKKCLKSLNA